MQGPGVDSLLQVNGVTMTVAAHPLQRMGCRGCHYATDRMTGSSRFPHQSTGWKLLYDEATQTGGTTDTAGDPNRAIPKMDAVCLSCHSVFSDLDDGTSEESDCLACHDSKYNAPDVGDEIRKASNMGTVETSNTHREGESAPADFSAGVRHAECDDCHNAKEILPWAGAPFDGMSGVEVLSETTNTTPTLQTIAQVSNQTDLCFKCHSSGSGWSLTLPLSNYYVNNSGGSLPQGNKAVEFNTKNSAFHPVRAVGRNQSNALAQQLTSAGLSTTSQLACTDCHNSDETGDAVFERGKAGKSDFRPQGPHGSDYAPVLRHNYRASVDPLPTVYDANSFGLCFLCHDETLLTSGGSAYSEPDFATNYQSGGSTNMHWVHLKDILYRGYNEVAVCRLCHYNTHSNQRAANTEYRVWMPGGSAWQASNTPPDGVKSRMVNFAPTPYIEAASNSKPTWYINLDTVAHDNVVPRERRCNLYCHVNNFADVDTSVLMIRDYLPSAALDSDSKQY